MKVTTPFTITAADSEARTITGTIVEFDVPANASTGKVMFKAGSVEPANVKLNLEHDSARPIGKTLDMSLSPDGKSMIGTFKISNTQAGSDALVEAMDGLRDGFSLEANANDFAYNEDGTMVVSSAELVGVALTHNPAFGNARVTEVAATEGEEVSESLDESENPTTTEGDEVDNTVTPAEAVETVEAAKSVTAAAAPSYSVGKTRTPITSAAAYIEHKVRAAKGDFDSQGFIRVADADLASIKAADTAGNTGLVANVI